MKASATFQKHFILVTASLVVALGIPVFISIFSAPTVLDTPPRPSSARAPSSVAEKSQTYPISNTDSAGSQTVVCQSGETDLGAFPGSHLRLMTGTCGSFQKVQVRNATNGFTADTMLLKADQLTTDYIDLAEGNNVIEISRYDQQGTVKKQLVKVFRAPASLPQ